MKYFLLAVLVFSCGCASVDSVDRTNERLDQLEQRISAVEAREPAQAQQGDLTRELARLRVERAAMQKRFTAKHPTLIRMNGMISDLEKAEEILNAQRELKNLKVRRTLH